MRRGDQRTITVDGKPLEAEYLGRGQCATAFRGLADGRVYLFVSEDDHMKNAVEMWTTDGMPHVPQLKRHADDKARGKFRQVYSSPFYPTRTAEHREAWATYKTLKEAADRIRRAKYLGGWQPGGRSLLTDGLYFFQDVIEDTRGKVAESVTEALVELMNAASNYGCSITCEFPVRNLGVDDAGRIVFRDILFDAEKVQRQWAEKSKRRGGW